MNHDLEIIEDRIPKDLYQDMRVKCGLSPKLDEACEIGLKNSMYSIMVAEQGDVVGMGRVVGDGGCFCQVVDICVIPEKQGLGIGKMIIVAARKIQRKGFGIDASKVTFVCSRSISNGSSPAGMPYKDSK